MDRFTVIVFTIVDLFQRCGITLSDCDTFHHQLRHLLLNNEIDMIVDYNDIQLTLNGFNSFYDSSMYDTSDESDEDEYKTIFL